MISTRCVPEDSALFSFQIYCSSCKELNRHHNRLALVNSAEITHITIPANSEVVINGFTDKMHQRPATVAILH